MAERAVPVFQRMEAMAEPIPAPHDRTPDAMRAWADAQRVRVEAVDKVADWRPWLFPEDGDG